MLRIASALALLAASACSTASDDPRVAVRAATVDGPISSIEVELDGATRLVRVIELDDGERIIAIAAQDGRLLALAKTDVDAVVDYDVTTVDEAVIATCDGACAELDDTTAALLDIVVEDELSIADAPGWRLASSVQKKLDDTTSGMQDKIG
jgi:hypothetical protein